MLYQGEDENFFLLLAEPPEKVRLADIPPREYIFVVDVSGSMNGFPLDVSKDLLRSLIGSLRPTDTFNVILFSGTSTAMADRSVPANQENITTAIRVIDDQQGGGGTRLRSALAHAIAMPHEENSSRTIVVATDGYIAAEHDVFTLVRENLDEVNVFAFGIGSSVNRYLIEGIARAGKGEPFVVTDKREARAAARDFQSYISSPVLTGITIDCGSFEAYAVEPMAIPDLMGQRPIQVFGKWRGAIRGTTGKGEYEQTFDVAHTPPREENESLRYLWARARLTELSDYCDQPDHPENIKAVIALGLKYELLTRHTSFVAVHEVVRNTGGDSVDVKQPLPLPQGVSDLAVGGPQPSPYAASVAVGSAAMPEPDLAVMLVIMAACAVVAFVCSGLSIRAGESG
jgi:Ca-activated chloride channel family protein